MPSRSSSTPTASFGTISSSIRFKEDIHDMADMSQRLFNLRPVTFPLHEAVFEWLEAHPVRLVAEEVAFPELAVRDANGNGDRPLRNAQRCCSMS